jgi:hypothetical protein
MRSCWVLHVAVASCRRYGPPCELQKVASSGTVIYMRRFPQGRLPRDPSSPW